MAKKNTSVSISKMEEPPKNLDDHIFYGLKLDTDQKNFRDAIWSDQYDAVFCNAKSGSGKTTIAVATAMLMFEYGLIDSIVYMSAAGVHEHKQGLLPGTLEEKSQFNYLPLKQALLKIGIDPNHVICSDMNMMAQKDGSATILAQTDSYIRGINIGDVDNRALMIVDETQNFTREALRAVMTRINNGKIVLIGCDCQIDLKFPQDSGFVRAINLYSQKERAKVCELTKCYRGWVAELADGI